MQNIASVSSPSTGRHEVNLFNAKSTKSTDSMNDSISRGSSLLRLLDASWLRPLNDESALDELIQRVNPVWSLRKIRARIIAIRNETVDTRTFVLRPNLHWRGFTAGQYVQVHVEIDGRQLMRCYSLSSGPEAQTVAITVKRQSSGKVSRHFNERVAIGDVVSLSEAMGDFVLPDPIPPKLLLISAGSGVTPIHSILEQLALSNYSGDVILRHVCRDQSDFIFGKQIRDLAARLPGLKIIPWFSADHGRPSVAELLEPIADYADRHTMLCGPGTMINAVRAHWLEQGLAYRLQFERFGLTPMVSDPAAVGETQSVHAARSGVTIDARPGHPLLAEAEAAGLHPAYGCRMGICHSCKCRKRSGVVENLLTGEISAEPNEIIQLCISSARSSLDLDI